MYLLYLDDSGSAPSKVERHYVLSGICVFERQVHFLGKGLDALASEICPTDPRQLEFHGNHMWSGKGFWRSLRDKSQRRKHIVSALATSRKLQGIWCLFGVVIDKESVSPRDPIEIAFEQICSRFDQFLKRRYRAGDRQRGLIILDKSSQETRLQGLAADFKVLGHKWGVMHSVVDVPMFVDSKATRHIQFADLVSYALWQKFEHGNAEFLNEIDTAFDTEGGIVHGLLHMKAKGEYCDCPYCATRGGRLL